jgi:hypothetical protein
MASPKYFPFLSLLLGVLGVLAVNLWTLRLIFGRYGSRRQQILLW